MISITYSVLAYEILRITHTYRSYLTGVPSICVDLREIRYGIKGLLRHHGRETDGRSQTIKTAYRRLARKYHPDVSKDRMPKPASKRSLKPGKC